MIHKTDQWLKKYLKETEVQNANTSQRFQLQQNYLISPLQKYFNGVPLENIQLHLHQFGLFIPHKKENDKLKRWMKRDYKSMVQKLFEHFQDKWDGPSTSIFLFPSNEENRELSHVFSGNSGLSFPDKLFLFLSAEATTKQLAALFLHEYSHVCRLDRKYSKNKELNLLDAMILEGIAEVLVRKKLGDEAGNKYLKNLDHATFIKYWNRWIKGNEEVTRKDPLHDQIMFGSYRVPKNLGYLLGFYLVNHYIDNNTMSSKKMIYLDNEVFLDVFS